MTLEGNNNIFQSRIPPGSSTAYCRQHLDDNCMSALNAKFSQLAGEHHPNGPETDICSSIASGLQADLPSSCTGLTSNARPLLVRGVPLTGSQAPSPPSEAQNSSSNCHPTLPKSNDLTRVFAYNISASVYVNETAPAIEGETPVWSVFWSKDRSDRNDGVTIENPSVQMVCLRPVEKTVVGEMNKVRGAASTLAFRNGLSSGWGLIISVGVVMFLFEML
ncbi:hypothetical protein EMPG_13049 [Blastomyces silverae]|uniref:Uncharacterized protein n=1 Tax=Blastomyces silverae TaxID=2060906 RepID=A0A0H1BLC0_9EURO|nr:hypothetical protein EMPG_13049 [Blastomyces silverae]